MNMHDYFGQFNLVNFKENSDTETDANFKN